MKQVDQGKGRRRLRMPSPAMVVALAALFVALTGSAFAAASFRHGPKGIVNADDIAYNSITWKEIKQHTLKSVNFSPAAIQALHGQRGLAGLSGPTGPAGPTGPGGPAGPAGAAGPFGVLKLIYRSSGTLTNLAGKFEYGYAGCDSGYYALGGGVDIGSGSQYVNASFPGNSAGTGFSTTGWVAKITNTDVVDHSAFVYVICAPAGSVGKTSAAGTVGKVGTLVKAMKPE